MGLQSGISHAPEVLGGCSKWLFERDLEDSLLPEVPLLPNKARR